MKESIRHQRMADRSPQAVELRAAQRDYLLSGLAWLVFVAAMFFVLWAVAR